MSTEIRFKMMEGYEDLAPSKAHESDAGYDLCARHPVLIPPGHTILIKTGLFLELPPYWEAQIRPRSGLALKHGITVLNAPGTIDSQYRGEVGVILHNTSTETFSLPCSGCRIAQMVIKPVPQTQLIEIKEIDQTERGEGGFGSTGV